MLRTELNVHFSKSAPIIFLYEESNTLDSERISAKLKESFLGNEIIYKDNITSLLTLTKVKYQRRLLLYNL